MTLQQLIYAVTVADQTSMNRAAQALFLSQSSLSASIHNLEQEIGLTIFRRTNRGVSPTPEGWIKKSARNFTGYQFSVFYFINSGFTLSLIHIYSCLIPPSSGNSEHRFLIG